ncbi:YlaH-like family protein [Peribacillus alkalitolerans]|uniref:YlaH-like family protein n=1 Tax=Peribacillus alkalitolerans TaxID=1550385 RepID=UPI001F07EF85|nr:YlaH-like family protein [Peribacillus alkalitolerans]
MDGVMESMSFFASLFKVHENPERGMWYLYFTVVLLSALVYNLGFAKKLSIGKNIVIYFTLFFGCTLLTFLAVFLPIAEGLLAAAIFLGIYKLRLRSHKKEQSIGEGK